MRGAFLDLFCCSYNGQDPLPLFPLKNECPIVGILHSRTVICSCDIHHTCDKSISLCGTSIVVPFLAVTTF